MCPDTKQVCPICLQEVDVPDYTAKYKVMEMFERGGQNLTTMELRFATLLRESPGRILSYEYIVSILWGTLEDPPETPIRELQLFAHHVRKKALEGKVPFRFVTIRGEGYKYLEDKPDTPPEEEQLHEV